MTAWISGGEAGVLELRMGGARADRRTYERFALPHYIDRDPVTTLAEQGKAYAKAFLEQFRAEAGIAPPAG